MALIAASRLEKYYGDDTLFSNLSFGIDASDRIGLVGRNGEGKTTLFRILLGIEEPSSGSVSVQRNLRLGHLPQTPPTLDERSLWDFLNGVFDDLHKTERTLDDLAAQMAEPGCSQSVIDRYTDLQHEFEVAGGYTINTRIQTILSGLGFSEDQHSMPLSQFSGGWRTRAYLAKLLLEEPDVLLLDEPTNHLDLNVTRWLENFLSSWRGALVIVSHDRFFLNKLCNRVWEMTGGGVETYKGNYDAFLQQREARYEERLRTWEAQQQYIQETQEFIRQHLAGQRTKEAQGRRTRLERFMKEEAIQKPRLFRNIRIKFERVERSGDQVLQTHGLEIGYDGQTLAKVPNIELLRGHRLGIIGGNGTGKTTLIRTFLDELPKIAGAVRLGTRVEPGYLSQNHDDLDPNLTALDSIRQAQATPHDGAARNLLGSLLFSGDDVFKQVADLSGGERSRLAFARLALRGANLLMLDEPTNHLDIQSQEVLQGILKGYPGTLIFISHDRYLVQNLATHLVVFEDDQVIYFEGSWEDYVLKKQALANQAAAKTNSSGQAPGPAKVDYRKEKRKQNLLSRQKKRFEDVEEEIHDLEDEKRLLEYGIGKAGEEQNMDELNKLTEEHSRLGDKIAKLYDEWAELSEILDG